MNWHLLINSLLVSAVATALAGLLGFLAALWLAGLEERWQRRLLALTIAALALPPFLVTNTWIDLLGQNGVLHRWLPFNIYSLGGAAWLLALLTWPITTLLTLGAWRKIQPEQLEADPLLTGSALLRWLLWPAARHSVALTATVTFVLAMNNFSVPVILQVPVFAEELWLALTARLNESGAWAAAIPLMLAPALLLVVWRKADFDWPRHQGSATSTAFRRAVGPRWTRLSAVVACGLLLVSLGLPLLQIAAASRTWTELPGLLLASPGVVANSVFYATGTATVCVVLGLMLWRLRVGYLLWLVFFVPGVLLGRGMISTFNHPGVGVIYGTAGMVFIAFALRYLALTWSGARLAMQGVDRDIVDAVRLEGASAWEVFRIAEWPQIAPAIAASWYVVYLLALWDVETLVLIYPPGSETLALRVFNLLHYGHNAQVNAHCVLLLGLAVAPLAVWSAAAMIAARRDE